MSHGWSHWLNRVPGQGIGEEGWIDGAGNCYGADGYKSPAISPSVYSSSRNVLYLNCIRSFAYQPLVH